MKLRVWGSLVLLVGLALFPFGWLGEIWPEFGAWLGSIFPSQVEHAIGHGLIFFLLGVLLLLAVPRLRDQPLRYLCILMLVALAQEGVQILSKLRPTWVDESRDLAIDLLALLLALAAVRLWERSQKPEA